MQPTVTRHGVHLELQNDRGEPIAHFMWWDGSPTFAVITGGEGRLLRPELEAMRDWCTHVLARMDCCAEEG